MRTTPSVKLVSLFNRNSWMFNVKGQKTEELWAEFISPNSRCLHVNLMLSLPVFADREN